MPTSLSKEEIEEAIAKGFANAPTRHPAFAMPRTMAGWLGLVISAGTIVGGTSWLVITISVIKTRSDLDMSPAAELRFAEVERAIDFNKREHVAIANHMNVDGIHQTPSQKKLMMIENIQPIRNDIVKLQAQIQNNTKELMDIKEALVELQRTLDDATQ